MPHGKTKEWGVETDRCADQKKAAVIHHPSRQEVMMARTGKTEVVAGEADRSIFIFI